MTIDPRYEILLSIYSIDYLLRCNVVELAGKELRLAPVSGKTVLILWC